MAQSPKTILARGKEVLRIEAQAVEALVPHINKDFEAAVKVVLGCTGRVIVTGMGKAGLIGQKLSATLASTGTPSYSLHPAEAIHGDMGRITKEDVILAFSKSGESEELIRLLPIIKRIGAQVIGFTGRMESSLAKHSDIVLDVSVNREACTLNLAPTSSTTAMLAMGDALAVVVMEQKGFKERDFALFHPGGQLGRQLLSVAEIMRTGKDNPIVKHSDKVEQVLLAITQARAGSASVVDAQGKLLGIFTDGDLRRHLRESGTDFVKGKVSEVMTENPKTISEECLVEEAMRKLQEYRIDEIVVVDKKNKPVGLLDIQDLLKAGFDEPAKDSKTKRSPLSRRQ